MEYGSRVRTNLVGRRKRPGRLAFVLSVQMRRGEGGMALWLGLREAEEVAARAPALSGVLGRGLERRGGVQR